MKIYHDNDVDDAIVRDKVIAVIGYGIQGRAQAQNWKDSGFKVIVGLRPEGKTWQQAKDDGMEVMAIEDAAKKGDIICLLTPDMPQKEIYQTQIKKHMKAGKTLYFSHGFNITYKQIRIPSGVDVIMAAPKGPGAKVRQTYKEGFGTPAVIAVAQDASGNAKNIALAMAKGLHSTKAGVFECTFDQETYTDLFGEQAVLCGGTAELIKAGFETLVEDGFPPEMAYFEVLHELKLIVDLIQEGGLEYMWSKVSETARYGGRTRGKLVVDARTKKKMKKILGQIKGGKFAREWIKEYYSGKKIFEDMREKESQHQIEIVGAEIRSLFQKPK
ncbi:Ketol-acid reductoisomerase (NAD(+)) [Candidatus Gugararchaeum adminiculabundum]|nr:Ketol-acid reductoisomerase (NAD(+)) [Candidatus Gugararchaeum adminiculabundum]